MNLGPKSGRRYTAVFLLGCSLLGASRVVPPARATGEDETARIMAEWRGIPDNPAGERYAFLDALAIAKKFDVLEEIAWSGETREDSYAIDAALQHMPSGDAVRLCDRLRPGSRDWDGAVWELRLHDRAVVVPYLRRVIRTGDATVRFGCYAVCAYARWPDLLDYAELDKNSEEGVGSFLAVLRETLGMEASGYLELFRPTGETGRR